MPRTKKRLGSTDLGTYCFVALKIRKLSNEKLIPLNQPFSNERDKRFLTKSLFTDILARFLRVDNDVENLELCLKGFPRNL